MKILPPLMTNSLPSALVGGGDPPASLPALASVNRRQPMISPLIQRRQPFLFLFLAAEGVNRIDGPDEVVAEISTPLDP